MNMNIKKRARILAGVLAAGIACSSASALSFTFSQGGFAEGATLTGNFSGDDSNGDGYLSHLPFALPTAIEEITSFSLSFSGNSLVGAFTLGLSELEGLSFKLGGDALIGNDFDPVLGPEGLAVFDGATGSYFFAGEVFTSLPGAQGEVGNFYSLSMDVSSSGASAAEQVPDAGSSAALLGGAMLGLFAIGRRCSRSG